MKSKLRRAGSVSAATDQTTNEKVMPADSQCKRVAESPSVALAPLAISQHTSAALGFKTPRAFLEWLIENGVPHVRRGKDRIVEATIALEHLRAAAQKGDEGKHRPVTDVDDEVDRVLATIGRRRVR
jgi:hypothetical protein